VTKTSQELAAAVLRERGEGDLLIAYQKLMQGLSFYTRSRVTQFEGLNEIRFGAERATDRDHFFWHDTERLAREWRSGRRIFIATEKKRVPELNALLDPPPRVLVTDRKRVLLVNFPVESAQAVSFRRRKGA
jgi:hypothetical protein